MTLEEEFREFKSSILEYIAGLKEWQSNTTEYRKKLCDKVDEIKDRINMLPCKERSSWYESMGKQVRILWVFFSSVVGLLLLDWFKKK